jgi:hypothetical protein
MSVQEGIIVMLRPRRYTDYSGDVTAIAQGGPSMYVNVSTLPTGGKRVEIADSDDVYCPFRVTLALDKDAAIRLALRLLPPDTMIKVAQFLTDEANADV